MGTGRLKACNLQIRYTSSIEEIFLEDSLFHPKVKAIFIPVQVAEDDLYLQSAAKPLETVIMRQLSEIFNASVSYESVRGGFNWRTKLIDPQLCGTSAEQHVRDRNLYYAREAMLTIASAKARHGEDVNIPNVFNQADSEQHSLVWSLNVPSGFQIPSQIFTPETLRRVLEDYKEDQANEQELLLSQIADVEVESESSRSARDVLQDLPDPSKNRRTSARVFARIEKSIAAAAADGDSSATSGTEWSDGESGDSSEDSFSDSGENSGEDSEE